MRLNEGGEKWWITLWNGDDLAAIQIRNYRPPPPENAEDNMQKRSLKSNYRWRGRRWLKIGVHKKFSNFRSQEWRWWNTRARPRAETGRTKRKSNGGGRVVTSALRHVYAATRVSEWSETSSNNLIYEYFAATRMLRLLRTSFEYSGIVLLFAEVTRISASFQYLNNVRKRLSLIAHFCHYIYRWQKRFSGRRGTKRW